MTSEQEEITLAPAEEETAKPIELQEPKGISAFGRALYRKLKSSLDTGRDEECFNMVQQLLKESPYDAALNALSHKLGKQLYKTAAAQLPVVLAGGRLAHITQLVTRLRSMADESELENLVGYRDAAAMVDAAERKRWQSSLMSALCKMRETTDLKGREELALSIEMFAQEKRLTLTPEQTALIARVHEDWCRYCRLQKVRAEYNKQLSAYHATEKKVTLRQDLTQCEHDLHENHKLTEELKELPEAVDLLALIEKLQKKVRAILVARHRRKVIIRSSICVVVTTILLILAVLAFAFMRGGSLKDDIEQGMAQKRVHDVANLVGGIDPMRTFCKAVHPGYEEALEAADNWIKVHNGYQNDIKALTPQLFDATEKLISPNVTAAELTSGLVLVDKVRKIEDKLKAEFNASAAKEPAALMAKFSERLAEIRPKVLDRFLNPAVGEDLEALKALHEEFLACTSLLSITEQEAAEVRSAMQDVAAVALRRMSRRSPEPQIAQEAVDTYDRYAKDLPLRPELRDELLAYADRTRAFAELPNTLKTVTDMQGYAAAIEACSDCYASVPQAFTPQEARDLMGKENDAMHAYQLKEFRSADSHPLAPEQILPHLQAVKGIYADGQSAYQLGKPNTLERLVTRILDNRNNVWGDGLHSVRMGPTVVVGTLNKGARSIRIVNNNRKPLQRNNPRKVSQADVDKAVSLKLSGARKAMGFDRANLTEGKITPARLMRNIATYNDSGCPEYARAYLFDLVVSLAQSMDPYSSGLAFSQSMREDIAAFEALAAKYNLYPGSWLNMHSASHDADFKAYFDKIATHDYYAEILGSVMKITDSRCSYAGYVNADGKPVRCREGEEPLYLIKDGTIVPYAGTPERPYTPLFIVTLPQK